MAISKEQIEELRESIKRVIEAVKKFVQKVFDIIHEYCRNLLEPKYENKSKYFDSNNYKFYKSNTKKSQVYSRKPVMIRCRNNI